MSKRLFRLTEIHQKIDDVLRREQKRKVPDLFELTRLKKMKLRAKDLMARLHRQPRRAH